MARREKLVSFDLGVGLQTVKAAAFFLFESSLSLLFSQFWQFLTQKQLK